MSHPTPDLSRRSALAALLAGSMALPSCVAGTSAPRTAADPFTTGPRPGDAATLTVLSQFGDNAALQKVLDRLNADYHRRRPKVTVKIQYLTLDDLTKTVPTTLASGAGPDIIDYDANEASLGELATSRLVVPLDAAAATYGWKRRLLPGTTARTTYGGRLYGVGRSSEAVGVYYNADLFHRLGAGPPGDYAAFEAAAARLHAAGVTPIAFGNKDLWPSSHLMGAALHASVPLRTIDGVERLSGTGTWADPAIERAFTLARQWVQRGWVTPRFNGVGFDDAVKGFFTGKAGMLVEGTAVTPDVLAGMSGTTVRFAPFPMVDRRLPLQAEGGVGGAWAISAASKAPAVAADWIDFVHFSAHAEETWLRAGVLPTTTYRPGPDVGVPSLIRDDLEAVRAVQAGGGIGSWTGYSSSPLVTDAWNSGAQRFLDGRIDAGRFAASLQKALTTARHQGGR